MKTQHTPTPWAVMDNKHASDKDRRFPIIAPELRNLGISGKMLAYASAPIIRSKKDETNDEYDLRREDIARANAAFIVKAVNYHDELVSHLENVLNAMGIEDGESDADYCKRRNKAVEEAFDLLYALEKAKGAA